MAAETPAYRKLSGRSGFLIVNRARIADDHLLATRTVFFMERYQRLFFRDLQTFSLHPSELRLWTGVITGVITFVTALIAIASGATGDNVGYVFAGIFGTAAVIAFALFVRNAVLGPGCVCTIRTAVQMVRLPSINRMRAAMRARAMIVERVAAAQADLAVEAPSPAGAFSNQPAPLPRPVFAPAPAATAQPPVRKPAVVDRVALLSVGATGVFTIIASIGLLYDYVETGPSGVAASLLTVLAALVASIVHLVVARAKHLPSSASRPAFALIFTTVGGAIASYVVMMIVVLGRLSPINVEHGRRTNGVIAITSMPPGTDSLVDALYTIECVAFLAVGVWALVVCARLALGSRVKQNEP